ncbi:TetR/AcrR family transcriptional regulator [Lactiplantibacillus pentosus]|nr:TetR/AcrR family transcriptional regulator [Lactiplantibacillus pentosus]MCT3308142.1 TetR/AcrR family transcriptional regulator [Lactiplantibacillus pentosus]
MFMSKYEKTHKKIIDAAITSFNQKTEKEITVTDIIKLAQIHHSTFYRHFNSFDDLIREMFESTMPDENLEQYSFSDSINILVEFVEDNFVFFRNLLKNRGKFDIIFRYFFQKNIFKNNETFAANELIYRGTVGMLEGWLENSDRINKDDIIHYLILLMRN